MGFLNRIIHFVGNSQTKGGNLQEKDDQLLPYHTQKIRDKVQSHYYSRTSQNLRFITYFHWLQCKSCSCNAAYLILHNCIVIVQCCTCLTPIFMQYYNGLQGGPAAFLDKKSNIYEAKAVFPWSHKVWMKRSLIRSLALQNQATLWTIEPTL